MLVASDRLGNNVARIPFFDSLDETDRPPVRGEQTFLLIGSDSRTKPATGAATSLTSVPAEQSGDVMLIAQVASDRRSATIVSIPGNSWVDIPGRGSDKTHVAYSSGNPGLVVETVERLTALRMDHVVVVDFARFDAVVDALGGIDVTAAAATPNGGATSQRGIDHLDGAATLAYLRQRDGLPGGDLDRARRQQDVLRAVASKVISSGIERNPTALYGLLDAISRSVSLDDTLTNGSLRSLAVDLRGLRPADFTLLRAPVSALVQGPQPVVYLDGPRAAGLWEAMRSGTTTSYAKRHPEDLLGAATR